MPYSHIQYQISNSCFLVDLDPIFKNFQIYWMDLQHFLAPFYLQDVGIFQTNIIYLVGIFLHYSESFGVSKIENNWFLGVMDTSTKSENHENEVFSSKMKLKSYLSQMKQNNSTKLLGHSFLTFYYENDRRPDPPDPTSNLFRSFLIFL